MTLVLKSSDRYAEVSTNVKTLLYKHNSTKGINISCYGKTLDNSLNWNISPTTKLIDLMRKIPKDHISSITVNGNLNEHLTPHEISFLKDNLSTLVFEKITEIPKHWCLVFYKSDVNKYHMVEEKFSNDEVVLQVVVNSVLEKTSNNNLVHQTPMDMLSRRVKKLEDENKELREMLDSRVEEKLGDLVNKSVEEIATKLIDEKIVETSKNIEETHDILNKFIDTIDTKITTIESKLLT